MKIIDESSNTVITNVTVFLTRLEAKEMRDSIEGLLNRNRNEHEHILSEDLDSEITICVYDPRDLSGLDEKVKMVLRN